MKMELNTNPFAILLAGLSTTEAVPVTLGFLEWVTEVVNKPSEVVQTYGEAFQVLQFLETARVVELLEMADQPGVYTIRKL
jgi:hypothetical protein